VQNLHNAQGQRVVKTVNGDANTAIHFLYDQLGQVIAEIDATTGATLREYIYVNGQQIAIVDDTGSQEEETYFVHNDHLGTPQKITDQTQAIVWDATYKPFGEVEVATAEIENNIRFPGQYADDETGLHYNYFRDYDPTTGRYVESDPIGLMGGLNTFAYVSSNPIAYIDPTGENAVVGCAVGAPAGPIGCGAGAAVGLGIQFGVQLASIYLIDKFFDNPPEDGCEDDNDCDTPLTNSEIVRLKNFLGGSEALHKEKQGYGAPPKFFDLYKCRNGDIVLKRKGSPAIVAYTGLNIYRIP